MKKIKHILILLFIGSIAFTGCKKNEPILFDDDSHAAFEEAEKVVTIEDGVTSVEVRVMLIGPHEDTDIDVPFEILATAEIGEDEITGNVTEGDEIADLGEKKFVIPANSSYGSINIEFNTDNIDDGTDYVLLLGLIEGDLKVSPSYNPVFVLEFSK